jgi:hypothetical protein
LVVDKLDQNVEETAHRQRQLYEVVSFGKLVLESGVEACSPWLYFEEVCFE